MKTEFSLKQLADPDIAEADKILRACVHCGFCTATCPTYVLLGDELDSPRGRIYLIKEMLEKDRPPTAAVVKHIDRCLSCLACMTTCPSGVNYMHLVDQARVRIEKEFRRPLVDRMLRAVLGRVLPDPKLFRASVWLAQFGQTRCCRKRTWPDAEAGRGQRSGRHVECRIAGSRESCRSGIENHRQRDFHFPVAALCRTPLRSEGV